MLGPSNIKVTHAQSLIARNFYIGGDFYVVMLTQKEVAGLVCHLA